MEKPDYIGNYRVVKELGRGSMGTVYLGHQESLGRDLAIKVLAPEFTRDPEFIERFRREGRVAASLRHPNIVRIFDADERDGFYYIAMEYSGDRDLSELLEEQGKLPLEESILIADRILAALHHAHQKGVVHRDVKPANVLLGGPGEVMLTDFSIARLAAADRLTRTGVMLGTPEYMAPEQFESSKTDARADLYAVGLIVLEMLTGEHPFRAPTVPEVMKHHLLTPAPDPCRLNPNIPAELGRVILKSLEKEPGKRFSTAEEMRMALLKAAGRQDGARDPLQSFLRSVESGSVSMDDAIRAKDLVKEAIDRGYKKILSVLMVDLAGSSAIKKPNQTLMADRAFRDYRATINEILERSGVMSYDWSGDGAICLFENAHNAVGAAVEIQTQISAVGSRHPDLPSALKARIGINTGEVYLDPRRSLGEFASRTVDRAGHLEKDCPVGGVHVSEATMEITRDRFHFKKIGVNRDEVVVYEIEGLAQGGNPIKPPAPKKEAVSLPKPSPEKHRAPPTRKIEPFRLWWGATFGAAAFVMGFMGAILNVLEMPDVGNTLGAIGILSLCLLLFLIPFLAPFYFWRGRKSAGVQSVLAFGVFFLALGLLIHLFGS